MPQAVPAAEVASKPSASVEDRLADLKVQPRVRRKRSQTRSGKRRGSARRKRTPRGLLIAGGILAALLVWASVVLLKTDKGTLIIEGIPENAEVLIDGERVDVVVDGKTMTAEAVLAEGEHQVRVTIDGGVVQGQTVSIRSDRETNLLFRQSETSAGGAPTNAMPNMTASQDGWRPMFNANDFSGWLHDPDYWSISNGVVVGKRGQQESQSPTYLVSQTVYQDFEAKFKIKLVGDASDSGFLFRSILTDEKALIVSGPQYNILQGDWGSLMMQGSSKGGLKGGSLQDADQAVVRSLVVPNDFNSVHVTCRGKDVVVALNGTNIIEGKFETIPSAGILAWQLYKGPDFDVHIKDAYVRAAQVPNGSPLTDELEKRKVSDTNGMLNEAGVTVDSRRVTEQQPEETVVVPEFEGADKRFLESLTTLIKAQPELYYWIVPNFAGDDGIRGTRFSYANAPSGYHPEIPDEPFRDKLLKHFDGNISARAREHAAQLAALHNKSLPASNRPPSQNSLGRRRIVVPAKSSGATLGNLRKGQIIIISHVSGEWGYGGQMKKSTVSPDVWHLSQYLTAQLSTPGGQTITLPGETAQCPFVYKVFSDGEHLISMNDGKKEDNVGDVTYDVEVFNSKPDWLGGDFVATTENLIQNPGAESFDEFANIHNWNLLTGRMLASTEIYRRKILNGKASFACGSCWKAILSQQIDLKRHQATFSAGETVVRLRTSVNTYNQPIDDRGSVRIAVYDENHRLLGSRDSGYRTTRNKWRQIENHYRIPVNARFLEIFLVGLRPAYNNNDVAFDDVSVELGRLNDQSGSASPRGLELIKPAVPRIQWSFNEQSERRELFSDPIATERFQSSDVSGQSLRFSDGSDAVTAHAPMRITGSSPRTVSFWVRPNQPFGDDRRVVFRWGDESHTGSKFAFLASSTEVMIHCRDQDFKVPYAIINEQWTHFMIVHDGQAIHVYADGKRIGEKGSTFLDTAETPITLSDGGSVSFYSPWRGEIDEFEVYDQALADVQLRDLGLKHHRFDLVEKTKAATERLDMFARQMSSLSDPGISLFNGRDLTGWQGSIQCWSAVDRELVGISGSKDRIPIVSDQEVAGDFELRFEINGTISNGGVRYRSSKAKSSASQAIEFDIGNGRWGRTGNIWSRPVVSRVGQKVILAPGGVRSTTALPTLEDNKSKTGISQEGWISCRIISTEFGIRHYVNGELVAEVLDPYRRLTQTGSIELATMRGSTIGLRFRNLILRSKRLER
ncbi:MAG: family 16 glycoside hydrolase [Planctomycetota bacterium]